MKHLNFIIYWNLLHKDRKRGYAYNGRAFEGGILPFASQICSKICRSISIQSDCTQLVFNLQFF